MGFLSNLFSKKNDDQKATLSKLQKRIDEQEMEIEALKKMVQAQDAENLPKTVSSAKEQSKFTCAKKNKAVIPDRLPTVTYSLDYIISKENAVTDNRASSRTASYDRSMRQWCLRIQLDDDRRMFLSVFFHENGTFAMFSLDDEGACDSHYEFVNEKGVRRKMYEEGDENKYLDEILTRYAKQHGASALVDAMMPFITAQFHYD